MRKHHVPSVDTRTYENIAFSEALKHSICPSITYDVSHWLFVPNTYTEYRYILGTRGTRPLICVGVNPSTAAPDHLDPTLQSVQRIALHNDYYDLMVELKNYLIENEENKKVFQDYCERLAQKRKQQRRKLKDYLD